MGVTIEAMEENELATEDDAILKSLSSTSIEIPTILYTSRSPVVEDTALRPSEEEAAREGSAQRGSLIFCQKGITIQNYLRNYNI